MLQLIPSAYAADAGAAAASPAAGLLQFAPMVVIFVLFYFLLIRPQQKRAKEQQAMLQAVTKGDEIVTTGGMLGRVTKTTDNYLTIEVADGVEVQIQRSAVAQRLEKGTIKNNK
ncbi:preprotein translocase subunit YajC [Silvimonas iriomotensis]|uniref:Sec translocon accessory complex subunit YajC n=1 Tax=Silvimonas iriomotensis TaxID=449662 RepID=A0ABQ2P898_9NEIS|nr:preprotein translocase subunit YajC [Silvimonas iriomotensis]GGP20831.1 preprotein translocase subunit YajC [Silvimonas iriomotensis]